MTENGSPFDFPCDIPVKIFGRNESSFRKAAYRIVRRHFPSFSDEDSRERPSREDRFVSITVTVHVESRAQIDALYTELTGHDSVIMVL